MWSWLLQQFKALYRLQLHTCSETASLILRLASVPSSVINCSIMEKCCQCSFWFYSVFFLLNYFFPPSTRCILLTGEWPAGAGSLLISDPEACFPKGFLSHAIHFCWGGVLKHCYYYYYYFLSRFTYFFRLFVLVRNKTNNYCTCKSNTAHNRKSFSI